jgi:2-oxopent-4-enoate/cis-2-oxohex-4-enoate hydratase
VAHALAQRLSGVALSTEPRRLADHEHRRLARVLVDAVRAGRPVPPLTDRHPELTVADAARIRDIGLAHRLAAGERLVGAVVTVPRGALDQPATPALGWLTDAMLLPAAVVNVGELIRPRVQPRLALELERPLRGPIRTVSDLLSATVRAYAALEVVDSRYDRDSLGPPDQIADNGGTAFVLLGPAVTPPAEGTLRRLRIDVDVEAGWVGLRDAGRAAGLSALDASLWLASQLSRARPDAAGGALLVAPAGGASVDLRPGVRVRAYDRQLGSFELWG